MRALAVIFLLLGTATLAVAQAQPAVVQDNVAPPVPADTTQAGSPHSTSSFPLQEERSYTDRNGVCYTMRTYYFARSGTEAPRLTGESTCVTPRRLAKRARQAPARLLPAK